MSDACPPPFRRKTLMDQATLAAYQRERAFALARGRKDLAQEIDKQIELLGGTPGVEQAIRTVRKRTATK